MESNRFRLVPIEIDKILLSILFARRLIDLHGQALDMSTLKVPQMIGSFYYIKLRIVIKIDEPRIPILPKSKLSAV